MFKFTLIATFLIFVTVISGKETIVFLGDSLTAGYNISQKMAFPNILESKLNTKNISIINAGISGDTSYTLLNRLDWTLSNTKPSIAFICIGANDGLRGTNIAVTKENIQKIINTTFKQNIRPILAGITLPKNYSPSYIQSFEQIFDELANENNILYLPFLLKNVAGEEKYNLSDRIHPNELGHKIIANTVYEFFITNKIISPNIHAKLKN